MKRENILKRLKNNSANIVLLDSVSSTNDYLKDYAKMGAKEKTIVISCVQTKGKGTKNRTFISREGGVYLSILLRPQFNGFDATLITPMTAVAVGDAINQISGKTPQIKWVNDLYLDGKKVCGILCEAGFDNNGKPFVIVGIGVNLFKPKGDFDPEIVDIATSVFDQENMQIKEEFTAFLIDTFFSYYEKIGSKTFLEKYRNSNLVLGKEISFLIDEKWQIGKAVSIDDNCRLIVELPDKSIKVLSSGDVVVKM